MTIIEENPAFHRPIGPGDAQWNTSFLDRIGPSKYFAICATERDIESMAEGAKTEIYNSCLLLQAHTSKKISAISFKLSEPTTITDAHHQQAAKILGMKHTL